MKKTVVGIIKISVLTQSKHIILGRTVSNYKS